MKKDFGKIFAQIFVFLAIPIVLGTINCFMKEDAVDLWGMGKFFSLFVPTALVLLFIIALAYSISKLEE